jgi:hypothetical protein
MSNPASPLAEPDPAPDPDRDPDAQRLWDIRRHAAHLLRRALPRPVDDAPEAWALRDRVALAAVASLVPASAAELQLAVNHVAANAHASDCMDEVAGQAHDPKRADQLRSQSAKMGREARGFVNTLLRLQAARKQREGTKEACDSAAWIEHGVLSQMTEAIERLPPGPPAPRGDAAEVSGEAPAGEARPPVKLRVLRDYNDWSDEEKRVDRLRWEVDRYAILKTRHAKLIRQLGGLPPNCDFEPPRDEVLQQLIRRTDSNITWVDTWEPWVHPDLRVPPAVRDPSGEPQ